MRILRVFPRRTTATPDDPMAFVGEPPLFRPEADEVHVSVTFTWDKPRAEYLRRSWARFYHVVKIGGPAYDDPGGEFVPGRYLKPGNVITQRGCPNHCHFCFVPGREGRVRTLPIREGHLLHDNNILACPPEHIDAVFDMLGRQPRRPVLAGGLEAGRVTKNIAHRIADLKARAYLAYDRPGDQAAVEDAAKMLLNTDERPRSVHWLSCYVLVGYEGDSIQKAAKRLQWVKSLDVTPLAMYYQPKNTKARTPPADWRKCVKAWARPAIIWAKKKKRGF